METIEFVGMRDGEKNDKEVFAKKEFQKGEVVLTFQGKKILRERGPYTLQIGPNEHLLVDGDYGYVNHSCDPNCGVKDKVTLIAIKNIEKGDEITFDYAMTESHLSGKKCLCGTKNCRKKITGFDRLLNKFKEKYKGFVSDYLLKSL